MKNNYSLLIVLLVCGWFSNLNAQVSQATPDFGSAAPDAFPSVVIQNVLENDVYNELPVSLSDVYISQVSATSNYLELDTASGAVKYVNGPAPAGTYYIAYNTQLNSNQAVIGWYTPVYVNIGCDAVNPPIITNVVQPNCSSITGSFTLEGLPEGQWQIYTNDNLAQTGTGSSASFTNVYPGKYTFRVKSSQGCMSPPSAPLEFRYLNAILSGTYADTNSDGIPSPGDTITYLITVTNQSNCTLTNITKVSGNLPLTASIASLAPGVTDNTTLTAIYTLTQADINAGSVSKSVSIRGTGGTITNYTTVSLQKTNYFNLTNGIGLVAFIDANGNGLQDANEPDFRNGEYTYEVNNDGTVHHISAWGVTSLFESNPANSYHITFNVDPNYIQYYGLSTPALNNITVPNGSGFTTIYFPLTIVPFTELAVQLYSVSAPPRPGFTYTNRLKIINLGNQPIASGSVNFTKSDQLSIVSVNPTGTVPTANGFTYAFTNLAAGESRLLDITLQVPTIPTVALGDIVTNTATASIPAGDVNELNNTTSYSQPIVGSYDPNDKSESHGGKIVHSAFTADDYLTYKIQFENTGTFPAEFVRINDVLDTQLDENSVRVIDASHRYTLERVGKNLSWLFDDIQLPPSVPNTNIGHGFVVFQVKPNPGYALGDIIPNTADIFFDFNPAIVTNTCNTEFVTALANPGFTFDQLQVYPNPVKNILHIRHNQVVSSIQVTSILGQKMLAKDINAFQADLDLSFLPAGIYFISFDAENQHKTIKITKE